MNITINGRPVSLIDIATDEDGVTMRYGYGLGLQFGGSIGGGDPGSLFPTVFPETLLTRTAILPKDEALNENPDFDADKDTPCVFACDLKGLDLSVDGYLWDAGGQGSGSYVGTREGALIVRAFDGDPSGALPGTWPVETAYLTSTVPSGDGTLCWAIDIDDGTVRAWWNGVELAQNGQGAATFPRTDYGGADESCYLGTEGGTIPLGETPASTGLVSVTGQSGLRYFRDQRIGTEALPEQVAGLTATGAEGLIDLDWVAVPLANPPVTEYRIERSADGGAFSVLATTAGTDYPDTDVENDVVYAYRVSAVSPAGAGPASAEASASPVFDTPAQVTGLSASGSDGAVELSWTIQTPAPIPAITDYLIERQVGGAGGFTLLATVAGTPYTDSAVTNGTLYTYRVSAVSPAGTSPVSAEASATPSEIPAFDPLSTFLPGDLGFIIDPAASAFKSDGAGGYTPDGIVPGDEIIRSVSQAPSGENFDRPGAAPYGLEYGLDGDLPYFEGRITGSTLEAATTTIPNCGATGRTVVVALRYGSGDTGAILAAGPSKALDSLSSARLRAKMVTNEGSVDVSPFTMPAVGEKYVLTVLTDFTSGTETHTLSVRGTELSSSTSLVGNTPDTSAIAWRLNASTSGGNGSTDAQFFYAYEIDRPLSAEDLEAVQDFAAGHAGISDEIIPEAITYTTEIGPSSAVLEELPSPQTATLAADDGQTGTILVVQSGATYDVPVTAMLNGTAMTEVASIQTRYPDTRQTARTTTFYSDETNGALEISSQMDRDFTLKSYVVKISGDQLRSWTKSDVRNVPIPDGLSVPVALNGVAHGDNNLLLALQHGDFGQELDDAAWELVGQQNSNALDLRVNAMFAETAGTVDAAWATSTNREFLGCQVIAFSPEADPTIGVDEPTVYGYIYPLNPALTSAEVPVTGTYRNAPFGGIEFRVVDASGTEVVAWAEAAEDSGTRTFTGTATVLATSDELFFEARFAGDPSVTWRQGNPFYVGVHVYWSGQSNQARFSGGSQITDEPVIAPKVLLYEIDDKRFTWDVGDGMANFFDGFMAGGEMPILCAMEAVGGSKLSEFEPGTEFYQRTEDAIAAFDFSFAAMGWHQGEGDCTNVSAGGTDESDYFNGLESIRDGHAASCGRTPSQMILMIESLGWAEGENVIQTPEQWAGFKNQQKEYGGIIPNAVFVSTDDDMVLNEPFHNYPRGYGRRGTRLAHHVRHLLGLEAESGLFDIGGAAATSGTGTNVALSYANAHPSATDFNVGTLPHFDGIGYVGTGSTSDIQGFEVSTDNWTTATPCTGVRVDAGNIALTHADLGTAARQLRYNWSTNGNKGGFVLDNGPLAAPLTFTGNLAVTPA